MELRHLRCFVVLAEELHFARAAERLHIDQSPLSRAIKELEDELGTLLFYRDRRGTRLTPAGAVFLQDVRRLFTTLDQARESVKAVSAGYRGSLRIAVSDGAIDPRLSEFLTRCRAEEPEIEIRLSEVPLAEQLRGLRAGDFNIGFAHTDNVGSGVVAEAIWRTPIVAVLPARHPLLIHKEVPLDELARFPVVMCDPQICEGYFQKLTRLLCTQEHQPNVIEHATSLDVMLTLVAAGYGIGFSSSARVATCRHPNIVVRPLAVESAVITTYLLRPDSESLSFPLERFMARLHAPAGE
ncbi:MULTISPECIES: LysR family transcriptional regulator [Pseudomonadota]|uniref:LysR family transcriptional regulator n=1 Tax=Pseudomonadota TaxID=1224 RepID=UPI00093A674E|nr:MULTISPECIES: LysR substrate-binding domain-containing protein [Pseudomonadota]MBX6317000.1 LysR family transcriptional regulator [Pigmentiphaga sp.]